jgi:GAF domain-containing protein
MSLWNKINPQIIPPNINPDDSLLVLRERILQYLYIAGAVLGAVAFFASAAVSVQRQEWTLLTINTIIVAGILFITMYRQLPYTLRAYFFILALYIIALSEFFESGLSGDSRVFLMAAAILAPALLNIRVGGIFTFISFLTMILFGWLMTTGRIPLPAIEVMANAGNAEDWITGTLIFILITMIIVSTFQVITSGVQRGLRIQQKLDEDLQTEKASLEKRIEQRTLELQRQINEMKAVSQIANQVTQSNDWEKLLTESIELIRSQFGFYHAGVFLLDERKEYAVLRAATGEAGRKMIENGHRLRVGEMGIVGYVVNRGEPRMTQNIAEDAYYFKNPLLPDTRCEMAIPLIIGNEVIGALDVQSERIGAFTPEDLKIFQIFADQLATALDKARLLTKLQDSFQVLEQSNIQFTRHSWRSFLTSSTKSFSYRYRQERIETGIPATPEAIEAYHSQKPVKAKIVDPLQKGKSPSAVALPIILRGQILGILNIRFEQEAYSEDMSDLLKTINEHLAVALENARLLEEIRVRADREHMVADISTKVRSSTDIEGILRTAVAEIGRSMGVSEVSIQLTPLENRAE